VPYEQHVLLARSTVYQNPVHNFKRLPKMPVFFSVLIYIDNIGVKYI